MGVKYTLDELIVFRAAQEIHDREIVVIGQGIPMAAGVLARKTHAPNSLIVTEAGLVGIDPFKVPLHIADTSCTRGYSYGCDMFDIFTTLVNRGYVDVAFLGVGQIDKYGNVNSSYIGNPDDYEMRLTGAGGAPEFAGHSKRSVYTMSGGEFVEKLDYFTSPGYVDGGNSRYEAGMPEGSGPSALITTKGVFRFDDDTKEMYLAGIHPGVTVEEIREQVPWPLKLSDPLEITRLPSQEEVSIIRAFAPDISVGRSLYVELLTRSVLDVLSKAAGRERGVPT